MAQRVPEKKAPRMALQVLPRGNAMVPDYRALKEAGVRRHHGMRHDPEQGPVLVDETTGKPDPTGKRAGGWVIVQNGIVEIASDDPHYAEYVRHVKDGDLWAATKETADACGVAFEPHFNDEHPEHTTSDHCQKHLKVQKDAEAKAVAEAKRLEAERSGKKIAASAEQSAPSK